MQSVFVSFYFLWIIDILVCDEGQNVGFFGCQNVVQVCVVKSVVINEIDMCDFCVFVFIDIEGQVYVIVVDIVGLCGDCDI